MVVNISNKNGIILKTANKLCTEDITLKVNESILGSGGSETKQLTIKWSGDVSGFYYSVDGEQELTYTTETTLTLNVKSCVILRWGLYVSTKNEETNCNLINGQGDTTYSYLYFLSVTGDNAVLDVTLQNNSGGAD